MSFRLKDRFYKAVMRPVMLHRSECLAVYNITELRVNITEMIMFRWICGVTWKDIIRHRLIRGNYSNRVASIVEKIMRENMLRWFGHVMRRDDLAGSESGYGN